MHDLIDGRGGADDTEQRLLLGLDYADGRIATNLSGLNWPSQFDEIRADDVTSLCSYPTVRGPRLLADRADGNHRCGAARCTRCAAWRVRMESERRFTAPVPEGRIR